MTDLDTFLKQNQAPVARGDLSARILAAADTAVPANDSASRKPWWAISGIAAMAVMAGFFVLQPNEASDEEWIQLAETSGFSELYEWVEGDESS